MRFVRKHPVKIILVAAVLMVTLSLAADFLAKDVLCVDNGDVSADVLVVLGGASTDRTGRAAELFWQQAAPLVISSGKGDCESNRLLIERAGVPETVILTECESTTTMENARKSVQLLREKGLKTAIIVTSWYHSRRALQCFRKVAPEIQFYSRPSYQASDRSQWKNRNIARYVRLEYLKLTYYWLRFGVTPF